MGVASGCGEQEVGVASGSGWNLWVWLLGVVVRRYIDFLILLIPTPLVSFNLCIKVWMTIVESGWNVWVWLVGVVSRRWVWLVGVGGIYGCGYWVWL